jgi:hypothetical protein
MIVPMKTITINVHRKGTGSEILDELKKHQGFEVAGIFPIGNIWPASSDTLSFFVLLRPEK